MRMLLILSLAYRALAFRSLNLSQRPFTTLAAERENQGFNPLKDFSDMMTNMDSVIDDFMNKRMGNGEVFYGKRKYKPSGRENTEGSYNGMGLSDKLRIDVTREQKEAFLEERRRHIDQQQS